LRVAGENREIRFVRNNSIGETHGEEDLGTAPPPEGVPGVGVGVGLLSTGVDEGVPGVGGGLVINRGRRRVAPGRRITSRRGDKCVVGRESAGVAENSILSTVSETPLAEAHVRNLFDVAESGGLTPCRQGGHIGH
jgi:hypothetical protein